MNKIQRNLITIALLSALAGNLLSACGLIRRPAPAAQPTATAVPPTALSPALATSSPTAPGEPTSDKSVPGKTATADTSATKETPTTAGPAQAGALKGMPAALRKLGNLRAAPGTDAEILAVFEAGTRVGLLGVTPQLTWAQVDAPGGLQGWVYFGNLELSGDLKDLPRVEPTATPVP